MAAAAGLAITLVPVLMGSSERDNGIHRLLKALRHEVPDVTVAAKRLGIDATADAIVGQFIDSEFVRGPGPHISEEFGEVRHFAKNRNGLPCLNEPKREP